MELLSCGPDQYHLSPKQEEPLSWALGFNRALLWSHPCPCIKGTCPLIACIPALLQAVLPMPGLRILCLNDPSSLPRLNDPFPTSIFPKEVQDRARSEKRKDMDNRLEDCPLFHQVSAWDCYESFLFFSSTMIFELGWPIPVSLGLSWF